MVKRNAIFLVLKYLFIEDEFRLPVNVSVSVSPPSSSKAENYERLRTIHCQKQVSNKR
jgi:hypothetical protein